MAKNTIPPLHHKKDDPAFLEQFLPPHFFNKFRRPDNYALISLGNQAQCLSDIGDSPFDGVLTNFWISDRKSAPDLITKIGNLFHAQLSEDENATSRNQGVLVASWDNGGPTTLIGSFSTASKRAYIDDPLEVHLSKTQKQLAWDGVDNTFTLMWQDASIMAYEDDKFPLLDLAMLLKNIINKEVLYSDLAKMKIPDAKGRIWDFYPEIDPQEIPQDELVVFRYLLSSAPDTKASKASSMLLQSIISAANLRSELEQVKIPPSKKPSKI